MSAPITELATILAIMAGMVLAEKQLGARRFWSGVKWFGLIGLAVALAYGMAEVMR